MSNKDWTWPNGQWAMTWLGLWNCNSNNKQFGQQNPGFGKWNWCCWKWRGKWKRCA